MEQFSILNMPLFIFLFFPLCYKLWMQYSFIICKELGIGCTNVSITYIITWNDGPYLYSFLYCHIEYWKCNYCPCNMPLRVLNGGWMYFSPIYWWWTDNLHNWSLGESSTLGKEYLENWISETFKQGLWRLFECFIFPLVSDKLNYIELNKGVCDLLAHPLVKRKIKLLPSR